MSILDDMELRKYRWSKDYESAEEELMRLFKFRNIAATRWEADAGEEIKPVTESSDKRLWCAEGSLLLVVQGRSFSLQPGDTLDIPAGMQHEGTAGIAGCVCYQYLP